MILRNFLASQHHFILQHSSFTEVNSFAATSHAAAIRAVAHLNKLKLIHEGRREGHDLLTQSPPSAEGRRCRVTVR